MGSILKKRFEQPIHEVCVGDFYLGRYEVTQKEWSVLMSENRSKFPGKNRPVDMVSWNDAKSFIKQLNSTENTRGYRLPTEAEWE